MTRLILVLVVAALASACASQGSDSGADDSTDARTFKAEMDAFVLATLPKLKETVGGTWGQRYTGVFYEKGGNTGNWEYVAAGSVEQPPGTRDEVLDNFEKVLKAQGMSVERPSPVNDISARKGNISVQVSGVRDSDVESVSAMRIEFSSWDLLHSEDNYAEEHRKTPIQPE